ncbi:MAG: glycosyltransferase family 1 protein [Spartobacteria bacterium]|nr:glycosyltransferase family 1 protein [Spartobacteria bacterium]
MNIFVDAREFTPRGPTGIARYLEHLFMPFTAGSSDDIIFLAAYPPCVPAALAARCEVVPVPAGPTAYVDHMVIPRIVRTRPDAVFFSPYYKTPLTGTFKRISVVHDILFLRRNDLPPWKKLLTLAYLYTCAHKVDCVLVDSEYTRKDVEQVVSGVANKLVVLYPDISAFWFEALPVEGAASRLEDIRSPYFLYVGNFNPHKNVDRLIEGFAAYRQAHPGEPAMLVLAGGDPTHLGQVHACAAACGYAKDILVLRQISDETLKALYTGATAFITASSYEGFGYPVVEAMACSCPVICSPGTSLGEISGGCALPLADPSTEHISRALRAIVELAPEERRVMTARAREHARRFFAGTAARELRIVLDKVTT